MCRIFVCSSEGVYLKVDVIYVGSCEHGDEPSGSGATEFFS
jgi:hypothetical protein